MEGQSFWRKCSVCKEDIHWSSVYYVCSVSNCNLQRAPTQFCSVTCWDVHNSVLSHRNAGADERRAPAVSGQTPRRILVSPKSNASASPLSEAQEEEILVVVSKLKAFIKSKSEMNVSADVMPLLSEFLRQKALGAIDAARTSGRKTVMARDFEGLF